MRDSARLPDNGRLVWRRCRDCQDGWKWAGVYCGFELLFEPRLLTPAQAGKVVRAGMTVMAVTEPPPFTRLNDSLSHMRVLAQQISGENPGRAIWVVVHPGRIAPVDIHGPMGPARKARPTSDDNSPPPF